MSQSKHNKDEKVNNDQKDLKSKAKYLNRRCQETRPALSLHASLSPKSGCVHLWIAIVSKQINVLGLF